MKLQIYTDGACSGNPGIGGWGVYYKPLNIRLNGGKLLTTNNEMELTAIYNAVDNYYNYGLCPGDELIICSDSTYCVNTFSIWLNGWISKGIIGEKKNCELIMKIHKKIVFLETKLSIKVSFKKVEGHSGIEENEVADELARAGINSIKEKDRFKADTLIVYIATGKYIQYLNGFLATIHKLDLGQKIIDVYTDSNIDLPVPVVNKIKIDDQYWPIIVLNKFKYILNSIRNHPEVKYVWYFDSKIEFTKEFIPKCKDDVITVFPHNSWLNVLNRTGEISNAWKAYHWDRELDKKSKAYIDFNLVNQPYIQSAAFGGRIDLMKEMCCTIENWIRYDLMHCVIPMWHDETYLNKYSLLYPYNVSFENPGTLGEKGSIVTDNENAPLNFRNTDEIQKEKQVIYNG